MLSQEKNNLYTLKSPYLLVIAHNISSLDHIVWQASKVIVLTTSRFHQGLTEKSINRQHRVLMIYKT